ncbi:TOBE domain-containing protein [Rhodophyticola porphyridii]|uniref:TOBE domain-containing protein n=1 Tax=Rhodophyticola porphyridii TaxID=1852017 RepID=UPI0035D12ABB
MVNAVETTGAASYLFTEGEPELIVTTEGTATIRAGDTIGVSVDPARVHLFEPETGASLRSASL